MRFIKKYLYIFILCFLVSLVYSPADTVLYNFYRFRNIFLPKIFFGAIFIYFKYMLLFFIIAEILRIVVKFILKSKIGPPARLYIVNVFIFFFIFNIFNTFAFKASENVDFSNFLNIIKFSTVIVFSIFIGVILSYVLLKIADRINSKKIIIIMLFGFIIIFTSIYITKKINTNSESLENGELNVVVFLLDTIRADYVDVKEVPFKNMPKIGKFAENAAVFQNHFSHCPSTTSSCATLMTGTYPSIHKAEEKYSIDKHIPTLAEILENRKYLTAGFYTNHYVSARFGFNRGFNTYYFTETEEHGYKILYYSLSSIRLMNKYDVKPFPSAQNLNSYAVPWLKNNYNKKFFLYLHYTDPHHPYLYPKEFKDVPDEIKKEDKLFLKKVWNQSNPHLTVKQMEHLKNMYINMLKYTDKNVYQIVKLIKDLGILNKTLIVIVSDHGEEFAEHGRLNHGKSIYNETIHVPLIISNPGNRFKFKNKKINQITRMIDVMPTILEVLNIPVPDICNGKSLLRFLVEQHPAWNNEFVYSERISGDEYLESYRDEDYRYYRVKEFKNDGTGKVISNEFYNLRKDPVEQNNIFDKNNDIVMKYRNKLIKVEDEIKKENVNSKRSKVNIDSETKKKLKTMGYLQ